jgi:hypothetical protein
VQQPHQGAAAAAVVLTWMCVGDIMLARDSVPPCSDAVQQPMRNTDGSVNFAIVVPAMSVWRARKAVPTRMVRVTRRGWSTSVLKDMNLW